MVRVAKGKHATEVLVSDDGSSPVGSDEWNAAPLDTGMEGNTESTKTLATGKITPTDTVTIVAAESGTADDFDLITYSETNANDRIYLYADAGDTITLKHNQSPGAGEAAIITLSAADITLSETVATLVIRRGTTFYETSENINYRSATATFTNKTIDANGTGNTITNIGDAEIESHTSTKIVGLPTQTSTLDMGGLNVDNIQNLIHDQTVLTYAATLAFDFAVDQEQTLTLTGDLTTLTTSNRAIGASKTVYVTADSTNRTLTFNTSWRTNPSTATVTVTANTFGVLVFGVRGGTAETDVYVSYAEFG